MKKLLSLSLLMAAGLFVYAQKPGTKGYPTHELKANAANCAPATGSKVLDLNNVRALINTGGNLWFDQITARYEIPKGSGHTVIYSGALWLAGTDVNNQLKAAAVQFRAGNDYWAGPLTTTGEAEIDADVCAQYDQLFEINRQEVESFNAWWEAGEFDNEFGTNTQAENFPGYQIPINILNWPAHGDVSKGQDFYLAPFYDRDGDGVYDPAGQGDYPWYDIEGDVECLSATDRRVTLFGDKTLWWVFNDKGNIHTESGADPIGMEIKAQAFAFATNDEINNMTFYNYELINRGTQTLFDTYFGTWVDTDLGGYDDDYVGCDVMRGLGYSYNGDAFDESFGYALGFGANPPAVAVDFFEGPYQDNDGQDNAFGIGPDEALNGLGYGDGIPDNERFGMRRFLYHNRQGQGNIAQTPPTTGIDYYNYLRGIWKDGTKFVYGGSAHISDPDADPNVNCDFMFPGDSDPMHWGTGGIPVPDWTEQTAGNVPFDRRFMQSAGPFTLLPGAVNNITVGVVYARAFAGDPFASVEAVRTADDKAQSLFENCFKVLDGPDAPFVDAQELDREIILTLSNPPSSNNFNEEYIELDPFIPEGTVESQIIWNLDTATGNYVPDTVVTALTYDRQYRFQGYQIYQVANSSVGPQDLRDADQARLVAQCDLEDEISQIINFEFDLDLNASVPVELANGANEGIQHSFRITEDLFASGDRRLVNHKTYYYLAIAYAYNEYKEYDPVDPDALDGQKFAYKASRKSPAGAISAIAAIPHSPTPEAGGTVQNANYGDGLPITRIEGQGNGGLTLDFTAETEATIVNNGSMLNPTYAPGGGPIDVKIIDPLNVPPGRFRVRFTEDSTGSLDSASWSLEVIDDIPLVNGSGTIAAGTIYESDKRITIGNEQLFPEFGFSIAIGQHFYELRNASDYFTEPLTHTITFQDSARQWLTGFNDVDGFTAMNWIRAGLQDELNPTLSPYNDYVGIDDDEDYERVLGGWWAPWRLVHVGSAGPAGTYSNTAANADIADLPSVDVVFTNDKSKWTRCPVLEMQDDTVLAECGQLKGEIRLAPSRDKNGLKSGDPGYNSAEGDLHGTTGMSWFPGYAINMETGERMQIAFGEDTWMPGQNGRDMIWNPTDVGVADVIANDESYYMGGRHYLFLFDPERNQTGDPTHLPPYDGGEFMGQGMAGGNSQKLKIWRRATWIGLPMLARGQELLSTDVRVRLRVKKPYERFNPGYTTDENDWQPLYEFDTRTAFTETNSNAAADTTLSMINVVPNPYYAYSGYETNRVDSRIKIVNLPETCQVRIYNVAGTLVREFGKDGPATYLDWDLKNQKGIPISGGAYIIHVDVPGVGERVLKWFGALRPADLENF